MDAQQELFIKLLIELKTLFNDFTLDCPVYDGFMPAEDTDYPFIYLADSLQDEQTTKSKLLGNITQTIHIWNSDPHKRGTTSRIAEQIKRVCRKIGNTDNYNWMVVGLTQQTIVDRTTKVPLMHTILTIEFKYS